MSRGMLKREERRCSPRAIRLGCLIPPKGKQRSGSEAERRCEAGRNGDRDHEVSIQMRVGAEDRVGRGPSSNTSMMIIRPPQHGHRRAGEAVAIAVGLGVRALGRDLGRCKQLGGSLDVARSNRSCTGRMEITCVRLGRDRLGQLLHRREVADLNPGVPAVEETPSRFDAHRRQQLAGSCGSASLGSCRGSALPTERAPPFPPASDDRRSSGRCSAGP